MTKRQRTILFFILLGLFLVAAPSAALYSEGYRIDWTNRRITQSGAFFFRTEPTRVRVLVNGKDVATTDFVFGRTLTKNFLPGTYHVSLEKEDFRSWQKELPIHPSLVTEAKNVILFPQEIEFEQISAPEPTAVLSEDTTDVKSASSEELPEKIQNIATEFTRSLDGKKVAYTQGAELWIYYLAATDDQPRHQQGDDIFLTRFSQQIENLAWLTSHYIVFSTGDTIKISEIDDRDSLNVFDIASFENPTLSWNASAKTILVESAGKHYQSSPLF